MRLPLQRIHARSTAMRWVGVASLVFGATLLPSASAEAVSFSNPQSISIADLSHFSPYPSTIAVSGLAGTISKVTVTINDLSHELPADIDMVLVGPGGIGYTVLMGDVGDGHTAVDALTNVDLTFDDAAATSLTHASITAGTYRPSLMGTYNLDPSLTNTSLSVFNGHTANGDWSLYGADDENLGSGSISGGWSLDITTTLPAPVVTSFAPSEGRAGDTVIVTGIGFTGATAVKFGGTSAAMFTVDSSTSITAVVPTRAGAGPISIVGPGGTAAGATSYVVHHDRGISLDLIGARAKGKVNVDDGFAACRKGLPVKIQRRRNGRWRAVAATLSNGEGEYSVPGTFKSGTFRASAREMTLSSGDVCERAKSPRASPSR